MRILCVCLGNICRSPLAEGIFRAKAKELGYADFEVDSCGTANYHVGEAPDRRSVKKGKEYGIDISGLRGRQFSYTDFEDFDVIFVMDHSNLRNVLSLDREGKYHHKVKLVLDESHPGSKLEVPDPYYGGEQGFEDVYRMLDIAANAFYEKLQA